jgi:hypothetical protein
MKDEQVWRPVDLKHVVINYEGYQIRIYPTIREDGTVWWSAIMEIAEHHMVLIHVPEQETFWNAYETLIGALETFIGGLLGLSKALLNHKEKALGKGKG